MPPIAKKTEKTDTREVLYPKPEAKTFTVAGGNPITYQMAVEIMGWMTEDEFKEQVKKDKGESAKEYKVGYGDDYLLKDESGKKVRCFRNTQNRPFKEAWAKSLKQEFLMSGPGLPEKKRRFKLNGECIIIGKYGTVISAQHRLAGFILAVQEWRKNFEKWKHVWPTEPVFETFASLGIDEDQDTVRTIDNVQPRSLADAFYTSDVFAKVKHSVQRAEITRYLEKAVDLLWKRTDAGSQTRYQTVAESCDFLDRHPKLIGCVKHVFDENGGGDKAGRAISALKLSPGEVAALMFLMATGESDRAEYEKTRSQKGLNFDLDEKASQFVCRLGMQPDLAPDFEPFRKVLAEMVEEEDGARAVEKRAVVVRAWHLFVRGKPLTLKDLRLEYVTDDNGNAHLKEYPSCGGIDQSDHIERTPTGPTPEEVEAAKAQTRKEAADKLLAKIKEKAAERQAVNGQAPTPSTPTSSQPVPPSPPSPPKLIKPVGKKPTPAPKPSLKGGV